MNATPATLSPLAVARDAENAAADRHAFETVRGILAEALERCEVEFRGMDDDVVAEILNGLQALKARAAGEAGK
jgi:hypothetical protein